MATVGQQLLYPEYGWKRYDDTNKALTYTGTWSSVSGPGLANFNQTRRESTATGALVSFTFFGTKLRIISVVNSNGPTSVQVAIDDAQNTFSCNGATTVAQALVFEQTGLSQGNHSVTITLTQASNFVFDAIDTDGYLVDSNGNRVPGAWCTSIQDMIVGDRIVAEYTAPTSDQVGTFKNLGTSTASLIPAASSATPNGAFYFIMVDRDYLGRKLLVADRNIQSGISWDTLNTAGIASGSGLPYSFLRDLVPVMTSDTSPGICSISGFSDAWKIFDGYESSNVYFSASQNIIIDFLSPISVQGMSYFADGSYVVKSFTLSGSNDGSTWTTIQSVSAPQVQRNTVLFDVVTYRYYQISNVQIYSSGVADRAFKSIQLIGPSSKEHTLRLLTGGTSSQDTNNEWDKYIVNSTLNGAITAGDNNVWNWSGLYSWASTVGSSAGTWRVTRGYSAANTWDQAGSSSVNSIYGFRPMLVVDPPAPQKKFLIQDGMDIEAYVSSTWTTIGSAPATQDMFDQNGMTDLSVLTPDAIQQLTSSQPKLLFWTDDTQTPSHTATITAVPAPRLVFPTGDIDLPPQGFQSIQLNASVSGSGVLGVLASVDGGETWHSYNGGAWAVVDTTDLATVKSLVMTPDTFNGLTLDQWQKLIGSSTKIRFAYYIEQATSIDQAAADFLTITANPVSMVTPTINSLSVQADQISLENRLKSLEQINAINLSKLNFKSNALIKSAQYSMYDMIVDTFEDVGTVDTAATTATYDTVNKAYIGPGDVVMPIQTLPDPRSKLMINADADPEAAFSYSLDGGATWNAATLGTIMDISCASGNQLKIRATLTGSSQLRALSYAWV